MFTRTSLIAALTIAATAVTAPSAHAIVNGRDAAAGDFPFMAQVLLVRDDYYGELWLYNNQSSRTASVTLKAVIGTGFNAYTSFGIGDWDRDGHLDLIARQNGHGSSPLYLFPGQSKRVPSTNPAVRIGQGWEGYSPFGFTDWDRDGHQDLLTRNDASQTLFLVPGISYRGPSNSSLITIGTGY